MQQFPKNYLFQYFDELKAKFDLKFALNLEVKENYLEIINKIESFEKDAYNRWILIHINTYDNEINLMEEKLRKTQNKRSNIISN